MIRMTLKQFEYFLRVADTGGFSKAAVLLGTTQSSLSRQVRLLEVELRQNLFYRNGRGVMLTEAGKRFVEHCRATLESVARARNDLVELAQNSTGRVVIGLPPRIARSLTALLVQTFRTKFPRATISVTEGLTSALTDWLIMGRMDLALLFSPLPSPHLEMETLYSEESVLVGIHERKSSRNSTIRFSRLSAYPLILPQMPNVTRTLVESICKRTGVKLQIVAEVDTLQSILELVCLNQGCAILPRSFVSVVSPLRRLTISRIHSPAIRSSLVLASPRQRPITKLAEETRSLIRAFDIPRLMRAEPVTPPHYQ